MKNKTKKLKNSYRSMNVSDLIQFIFKLNEAALDNRLNRKDSIQFFLANKVLSKRIGNYENQFEIFDFYRQTGLISV